MSRVHFRGIQMLNMTFSLKGLKTIIFKTTNRSQHVEFFHSLIFFMVQRKRVNVCLYWAENESESNIASIFQINVIIEQ